MRPLSPATKERTGLSYELNPYETSHLYTEIFVDQVYEIRGLELPTRPKVLDLGSNIGMFAAYALRSWPDAEVVCVEPIPELARLLRANFADMPRVTVEEAAVGSREGTVSLTYFPGFSIFSGVGVAESEVRANVRMDLERSARELPERSRQVLMEAAPFLVDARIVAEDRDCRSVTLSSLLAKYGPIDLLKMDIEHKEVEILSSLSPSDWSQLSAVCLEPQMRNADLAAARELLVRNDFRIVSFPDDRSATPGRFTALRSGK